ncbi:hypothetical protein ABK040_004114 [Willaertia magna]
MSLEQLKDALKENLEKRGVLNKIRANLRAEIFNTFEEENQEANPLFKKSKPVPSDIQFLINELILEYLEYNHFQYSKSVLLKESNQQEERIERKLLVNELNIKKMYHEDGDNNQPIPLLYHIVHKLRSEKVSSIPNPLISNRGDELEDLDSPPVNNHLNKKNNRIVNNPNSKITIVQQQPTEKRKENPITNNSNPTAINLIKQIASKKLPMPSPTIESNNLNTDFTKKKLSSRVIFTSRDYDTESDTTSVSSSIDSDKRKFSFGQFKPNERKINPYTSVDTTESFDTETLRHEPICISK